MLREIAICLRQLMLAMRHHCRTKTEIEQANRFVWQTDDCGEAESRTDKARGPYNRYTAEERARIGRYTAENGPTNASRHFLKQALQATGRES